MSVCLSVVRVARGERDLNDDDDDDDEYATESCESSKGTRPESARVHESERERERGRKVNF